MNTELKIVISGSFRKHLQDIGLALANFKKSNINILAPLTQETINGSDDFIFLATDDPEKSADIMEREYMTKIEQADFLYLANIDGYVGQSAATEIGVALMSSIPVIANESMADFSDEISDREQNLLKKSIFRQLPISEINSKKIAEMDLQSFTPYNFSAEEKTLLQSLVDRLLENIKSVKINV